MTLLELQEFLGRTLVEIKEPTETEEAHKKKIAEACAIANVSRVMVRNADIIFRRDEALGEGKLLDDAQIRSL